MVQSAMHHGVVLYIYIYICIFCYHFYLSFKKFTEQLFDIF